MSITIRKDAWRIKDDNGTYHSADLFSTMLPSEAQQLVEETRTEFTVMENEADEVLENIASAKREILNLEEQTKGAITSLGNTKKQEITEESSTQKEAITSLSNTKKQEITEESTTQKEAIVSLSNTKKQDINSEGAAQIRAVNAKGQEVLASIPEDYTELAKTVESIARESYIYDTTSGSTANFDVGADKMLIKSLVVDINPAQSGSGVPSQTNFRQINGAYEVNISHSRADTSNPEIHTISMPDSVGTLETFLSGDETDTYRGITIEKQYNELIINGTATGNARFKVSNTMAHAVSIQDSWLTETIDIPNGPKKVIIEIVSGEVTSGSMYCALYKSNGETTFTNVTDTTTTEPKNIITFEKSNNDAVCVVVYCPANTSVDNLHLRFTLFDPCVYGGTIDIVSGKLKNKYKKYTFDGIGAVSDGLSFAKGSSSSVLMYYSLSSNNSPLITTQATNVYVNNLKCSHFPFGTTTIPNSAFVVQGQLRVALPLDDPRNTAALFNAWVKEQYDNGTPLEMVAELSQPIEVQLTPQEIECFAGVNNIWADTGDVTVTYPVDTKTYIDKKIQEAIDGLSGS